MSDSTSSTIQTVSVFKEKGGAKSEYNNDMKVTSSYDGNNVEYYKTIRTQRGILTKNVKYFNVNEHDNKHFQNETNVRGNQRDKVNIVSCEKERSGRGSNSEFHSENYFVLIKKDKPRHSDNMYFVLIKQLKKPDISRSGHAL